MSIPSLAWIKQYPAMNTTLAEAFVSITTDSSGNVYGSYHTTGTVSGGDTNMGENDIVVFKMDVNGNLLWVKQHRNANSTGLEFNSQQNILVDSSGNIYIAYQAAAAISGGVFSGGLRDIVLLKLDNNGNIVWIKQHTSLNTAGLDAGNRIVMDSSENIYLSYVSDRTVSGGTSLGDYDVVLSKLNKNGDILWIKQQAILNTITADTSVSMSIDSSGNVYMSYYTSGTISGGTNIGLNDIVVTKLDSNGNVIWIKQQPSMNTSVNDYSPFIGTDSSGNSYVTYYTTGTVSGGTKISPTSTHRSVIIFKLDTDGNLVWINQYPSLNPSDQFQQFLAVSSNGNIYLTFVTGSTVSGGTRLINGGVDAVFCRIDTNGNIVWIQQNPYWVAQGAGEANPYIALDSSGNIYASYATAGTVSGGTYLGGGGDIVVLKLVPPPPSNSTEAVAAGPSGISSYISAQTVTTDTQKATLAVDMRTSIKNASYANNTAKAADQLSYINSMISKVGASYTVPTANFASFTATLATSVSGLATQPIVSFFPTFSGTSAILNVASVTNTSYLHVEVPVNYSVTLQNGIDTKTLTYNGTSYTDGTNTYTTNTSIVLGEKRYTLVGIGSLFFSLSNRNVECMVQGTQILTPAGYVPIESLHDGDLVITGAKQVVPISNMHKIVVVRATEKNAPYVIEKDAFGTNCPPNRLEVSPRHAIQLEPGLWEMPREAAKENKRVYQNKDALGKEVVYYHFSLSNYETDSIVANGQITECLNDGKTVVESYVWDNERRGYRRVTKPIEQKHANATA